jgi:gliding motility-associated-like protein
LAYPEATTTYYVTGTDASGCVAYDTVVVSVDIKCNEFFIPDIFTPNGSGPTANEKLCAFSNCVRQFNLIIYDRWGEKVFETSDINICWDGKYKDKEAPPGAYAYKAYLEQVNNNIINQTGVITLMR